MTIYWATSYFLKPEKAGDYKKWLNSKEAKSIAKSIEKETGFKYLNTYFPILGLGEYDAEDWMAAPDWASADKIRGSNGWAKWAEKTWDMIDQSRSFKSRVMRTASDVKVFTPTKK
jgi:hypothetical protein